jgi:7-cyano-7-deazaguanine reductase
MMSTMAVMAASVLAAGEVRAFYSMARAVQAGACGMAGLIGPAVGGVLSHHLTSHFPRRGAICYHAPLTGPDTMTDLKLGKTVDIPASPEAAELDRVPNPHPDTDYVARFVAPEFTSLCPVTGQPDFAHLVIDYVPDQWLVESKSLKLYLTSFRNHGAFHEDCTVAIGKRLRDLLGPRWLRIGGYWYPRGGIPIDVFWQTGAPPAGVWIPDQGVAPYRGRG